VAVLHASTLQGDSAAKEGYKRAQPTLLL
jgi:hypothetical protein